MIAKNVRGLANTIINISSSSVAQIIMIVNSSGPQLKETPVCFPVDFFLCRFEVTILNASTLVG